MYENNIYTCKDTCGQEKPCGNRYCSANPKHFQKKPPNASVKKPDKV